MAFIQPTQHKLKGGHIIRGAVGYGAALKVVRRNLNTTSNMHGNCAVLNGAENLEYMCDDLQLTDATAKIFCGGVEASAAKRGEEEDHIIGGAAAAATKLEEKYWNVYDLTVK